MAAAGGGDAERPGSGGLALLGLAPSAPSCPHGEPGGEEAAQAGWGCGPRRGEQRGRPGALTGLAEVAAVPGGRRGWHLPGRLCCSAPLRGVVFF